MRSRNVILLLASLLWISACGRSDEGRSTAGSAEPVHSGGVLHLALASDPSNLNPLIYRGTAANYVFAMLQPGFLRSEDGLEYKPSLARSWSWSEDHLSLDVELDVSLRWSDGEPFVAEDVVRSFELYRDPRIPFAHRQRLDDIESVEAVDAHTLRYRFQRRRLDMISAIVFDVLPSHLIEHLDPSEVAGWSLNQKPVTLGPYRLAEWSRGEHLDLERNPYHPGPPAPLDRIRIDIVPDASVRLLRLSTGEIDFMATVAVSELARLEKEPHLRLESVGGRLLSLLQYNVSDPILSDRRVRRAISLALDRKALVDGILFGHAQPGASLIPPVSWAHDFDLPPDPHDPVRTAELLREAGWSRSEGEEIYTREGQSLRLTMLTISGDPSREAIATAIAAQLREVGIELTLRPVEAASMGRALREEGFQILHARLTAPLDADVRVFFSEAGRFNLGHYHHDRLSALMDALFAADDRAQARAMAIEMQSLLMEEQPMTILFYPETILGLRDRLHGARPSFLSPFDHIEEWWVQEETS